MNRPPVAFVLILIVLLAGCGGAEDRKAAHMDKGNALVAEGNFEKARLEFKNVLQIDPKDIEARYALAQTLEKLQNWRGAAGHYLAIIEADPGNKKALSRMGQIYLLGRDVDKAAEMADKILSSDAKDPDGLVLRAAVKAARDDLDGAMEDAKLALATAPAHVNASALVASLQLRAGHSEESVKTLEEAIKLNAGDVTLRSLLARVDAQIGKNDEAAKLFAEIAEQEPAVLAHRIRLANFYVSQKRVDEAETVLKSAITDLPDEVMAKLAYAEFLAKQRSGDAAIEALGKMVDEQPDAYQLRFALGKLYEAVKDLPKARGVYEAIVEREAEGPNRLAAKTRLAILAGMEGDKDKALTIVEEVLKENPAAQDALLLRGTLSLDKGDAAAAVTDFRAALRDDPTSARKLRLLARAHLANGDTELALDTLRKAATENPTDVTVRGDLANLHSTQGDLDAAIEDLEGILKIDHGNETALEAEFKIYVYRKAWDKALAHTERIKTLHPSEPTGYYFAGLVYQAQGKFKESIEQFESALAVAPDAVQPLSQLIKSHLALNKKDIAEKRLREVIERNPKHFVAWNLLGELQLSDKRYEEAKKSFETATEGNKLWAIPYRNLASVYIGLGQNEKAVEIMKQGIEATNGAALLVTGLASYLESTGDLDSAIEQYENALRDAPNSLLAANNLAMLLIEYKDDQASKERARALSQPLAETDNAAYLDTAGWVEYKFANYDRAVQLLEKAVASAPDAAIMQYHVGMAYLAAGNRVLAKDHLKQAVESSVEFRGLEEAKTALKGLDAG